jgi:hypothetical protein
LSLFILFLLYREIEQGPVVPESAPATISGGVA